MEDVYIVGAARTPMGGMQGALADASANQLGGVAIAAALAAGDVAPGDVDELLMGCVLPAGQGQAPARQAGFAITFQCQQLRTFCRLLLKVKLNLDMLVSLRCLEWGI